MSGNLQPNGWKKYLRETRMARYPLATALIVIAVLALLWWWMPDFLRFLASLFGGADVPAAQ